MMKKFLHISYLLIFIVGILIVPTTITGAQTNISLVIDEIREEEFPKIETDISVLDGFGLPILALTKDNFSVSEDNQPVTDFEVVPIYEHPMGFVLVIDTSQSMGYGQEPTPIENIILLASDFIDSASSKDQFALITFSDEITKNQDLTDDKNAMKSELGKLALTGNPGHSLLNDALMNAVDVIKSQVERPMIILVTDGKDSGLSAYTLDQVIDEAVRQGVIVNSIAWGGADQADLDKIADRTHGEMQFLTGNQPDQVALQAAFNNIAKSLADMRVQYNLDFSSSLAADGAEHELIVTVDHLGSHAEASRRFNASPGEVKVDIPGYINGQDVGGLVHFAPDVDAPAPIKQMDVFLDGKHLDPVTSAPFEYVWDASELSYESHEISFVVVDESDNTGEAKIRLVVQPPVQVEITNPSEGETIDAPITISASPSAPFSQIAKVDFFIDGSLMESIKNAPYEVSWDLEEVAAGSHVIGVTATDIENFSAESEVSINVALRERIGPLWIALLAALAVAAVMIPLVVRGRRRRSSQTVAVSAGSSADMSDAVALQPGQAYLREEAGHSPGQVWPLGEGVLRLGRKRDENDLPLKGRRASRKHAVIQYQQGRYFISTLNPQNPVFINNQPIEQQQVLQPGDVIQAGETTLRFEQKG